MKKSREEFLESMKSQEFGLELELTGISRHEVENIIATYFNDNDLIDYQGRQWTVKYDGSIFAYKRCGDKLIPVSSGDYKVELVTPILEYGDISMFEELIGMIKKSGGVSGSKYRTGFHIHISEQGQNEATLRNLIRLMSARQYLLERALQIPDSRLSRYCQHVDSKLSSRCNKKFKDMEALHKAWDNTSDRYSMLNLSSLFDGKGIELRMFNGTLNLNKIKAYIQFSLALCQSARDLTRCSSMIPINNGNDLYVMRTWLCRMYLNGDEFKVCRKEMCKHLHGESAFANPYARKKGESFTEEELPFY